MGKFTVTQLVTGLRELADYVEDHPTLPIVLGDYTPTAEIESFFYGGDDEPTLPDIARQMGKCEKDVNGNYFEVFRTFGDGSVKLTFGASRAAVCTKRVIGKKTETRKVPKEYVEETVEVDDVEYSCPKSLLRDK